MGYNKHMKARSVYYTPQQVASFFAIRKDTLLFYDKIGLFAPAVRKENGYRYYSANQLNELDAILTLRDLGFSIQEIKQSKESMDVESFLALLGKEESRLTEKIGSYQALLDVNSAIRRTTEQAIAAEKETLFLEDLPQLPILMSDIMGDASETTSDEAWSEAYSRLLAVSDSRMIIHIGSIIERDEAKRSRGSIISSVYALYGKPSQDHIPKGKYACMYFAGPVDDVRPFYSKYLAAIEHHGFSLCSDIYEELTVSYVVTSDERKHVTKIMAKV